MKKPIVLTASWLIGVLASVAAACATAAPPSVAPASSTLAAGSPTFIALPAATPTPASSPTAVPPPAIAAVTAPATATAPLTPSATSTIRPTVATEAADITTTGAFFSLSVADLKTSTHWYSEKLGLKVVLEPPKTNGATVVVLEGGGLIVELIQVDGSRPLTAVAPAIQDKMLVQGIVKVGAIVQNFDQTVALLRARHVTIVLGPYPASADQRANIIVQDNDGNLIQFFGQ